MSKPKPKFRVGQVVYCRSGGTYVRIDKLIRSGTAFQPTAHFEYNGRKIEECQSALRPLTSREIGPRKGKRK